MDWRQLVNPNLNTAGNIGYCLAFGESAFGAPHLYPYATAAWNATQYRHLDQNFPSDVAVLLWWSYMVGDTDEGHVAINVPGRGILCSPWEQGTTQAWLPSVAELERIYSDDGAHPLTYLGWTEDIAGIQVAESYTPAPPAPLYTITPVTPFQITLNKQPTSEWNLNYSTFAEVAASPFSSGSAGDIKTIVATLTSTGDGLSQYTYYLENSSSPVGWNMLDCDPYIVPAPPVVTTPPAAPVPFKPAQTYIVLTPLKIFANAADAQQYLTDRSTGTLTAGTYYVWSQDGIAYDLSSSNMTDNNLWVNSLYNVTPKPAPVIPPVVTIPSPPVISGATIRASYRPLTSTGDPIEYEVVQNVLVTDIVSSGQPITVNRGALLHIYGVFRKGNQWYAMPKIKSSNAQASNYMYGIPVASATNFAPYLEDVFGLTTQIQYGWDSFYSKAVKTIEGIFKTKKKK